MSRITYKKFKRSFKKLFKYYNKKLKFFYKHDEYFSSCIRYFVCNLMLLRDFSIIATDYMKIDSNPIITSISAAIAEYEAAHDCIHKYYNISSNNCATKKDESKEANEVAKEFFTEKQQHLSNFFAIILANIDTWSDFYDNSI